MTPPIADDEQPPEFAKGGLVHGPDDEDSIPVSIDPRCEHIFTVEQARRFMAAKPGSRAALQDGDYDDPA